MSASSLKESRAKVAVRAEDGRDLGEVTLSLLQPSRSKATILIAHGAGGSMDSPSIVSLQKSLAEGGVRAVRFNFPYAEKGKKTPDRKPGLVGCWRHVADQVRKELRPAKLFLAGRSMGGRMASYLAADGYPADGLVLLAYPLHPPGKPDRQRKDHLEDIRMPVLFVSGTRDGFARLDLLEPVVKSMQGRLHLVEGADHGFRIPKKLGKSPAEIEAEIVRTVLAFVSETGG